MENELEVIDYLLQEQKKQNEYIMNRIHRGYWINNIWWFINLVLCIIIIFLCFKHPLSSLNFVYIGVYLLSSMLSNNHWKSHKNWCYRQIEESELLEKKYKSIEQFTHKYSKERSK